MVLVSIAALPGAGLGARRHDGHVRKSLRGGQCVSEVDPLPVTILRWRRATDVRRPATLLGTCDVRLGELRIFGVSIHEGTSGKRWCALPARAVLIGGKVQMKNDRPHFKPVLAWISPDAAGRFSGAVMRGVLALDPDAFSPA